jgi:hypothetical protein
MVTAVERPAVTDAAGSMHGFPAALTSFVGRAAVVDEIAGQLGQYRLVTVTLVLNTFGIARTVRKVLASSPRLSAR